MIHNPKKTIQQPKTIQQSKKKKILSPKINLTEVFSWQPNFLAKINIFSKNKNHPYFIIFISISYHLSIYQS